MKPVHFIYAGLWVVAGAYAWFSGPWSNSHQQAALTGPHDSMFHMHQPLHAGGKVAMVGQYHLELASTADGTHRLWLSDAFRKELDTAGFSGTLQIESDQEEPLELTFEHTDSRTELVAKSDPLGGQVWLKVNGHLDGAASFDGVSFFWDYDPDFDLDIPLGLDSMVPMPSDNKLSEEKVALGHSLFFDPQLSVNGKVSCATCHQPEHAFAEPNALARGVDDRVGRRNTPTVLNTAWLTSLFWDGRATTLEEQAIAPIIEHAEMGVTDVASLVSKLEPTYGTRMRSAFGRPLSLHTIGMAIASFERTLMSGDSDFDRFEAGDRNAISETAQRGRHLFFGKANCGNCHVPPLFTDVAFHNLGVGWSEDGPVDPGRFEATGDPRHQGAFKTPSLRDVALTAPYMHDGSLPTLRNVVEFYNKGCRPNPGVSPQVGPLNLSDDELDALVAFLKTLTGRTYGGSDVRLTGEIPGGRAAWKLPVQDLAISSPGEPGSETSSLFRKQHAPLTALTNSRALFGK